MCLMMNRKTMLTVVAIALWMPCLFCLASLGGCQAGTHGILRPVDATVEHTITNTVTQVIQAAPGVLPFPYGTAVQAGGAAVLAILAAWQGLTHSRVNQMQVQNEVTKKEKNT